MTPTEATRPPTTRVLLDRLRDLRLRDHWAIEMIAEHSLLTTRQLTTLGFHDRVGGAGRRLRALADRGWLRRYDNSTSGSLIRAGEALWGLGPLGALMTSPPGQSVARSAAVHRRQADLLSAHPIDDLVRANQWFVDLAAHCRTTSDADLRQWWSPRTCAAVVAPTRLETRYGEYIHRGRRIGFWVEAANSGLTLARLIRRHAAVTKRTDVGTLLVPTESLAQENAVREQLTRLHVNGMTVLTSCQRSGHPEDANWRPLKRDERIPLDHLPTSPQLHHPNDDAAFLNSHRLAPHPINDPDRPYDEAVVDGEYSYAIADPLNDLIRRPRHASIEPT